MKGPDLVGMEDITELLELSNTSTIKEIVGPIQKAMNLFEKNVSTMAFLPDVSRITLRIATLQLLTHTLRVIEDYFIIIGTILTLTTGISILALIDLKRSILPKWLNWLAIGTGILGIGLLGTLGTGVVKQVFDIITSITLGLMLVWMIAIGIIMIIQKEDAKLTEGM